MSQPREILSEVASVLYNDNAYFGEIFDACKTYKNLLLDASQFEITDTVVDDNVYTSSGKAIGPIMASYCVDDFMRTKKFCNGIYKAVQKIKAKQNKKVHLLYAGTGPFATLVLPLITQFSSEEISLTLLEINEDSYKGLTQTLDFFMAKEYVQTMECTDATTYMVNNSETVDILIVEAMTHALKGEHQVAISYNLVPQLKHEVILIPEVIHINLLVVNSENRSIHKKTIGSDISYYESLGNLFTVNIEEIRKYSSAFTAAFPTYIFQEKEVQIPENSNEEFDDLSIETFVRVFDDETLGIDECGLTILFKLFELNPMIQSAKGLSAKYICGKHPRLQCRLIN